MINIPQKNPRKAAAIVFGVGVVTVLVSRFLPAEQATWSQLATLIGTFLGGAGAVQVVKAPS